MKKVVQGCAVAIGVFLVLGIIGALFGGGSASRNAASPDRVTSDGGQQPTELSVAERTTPAEEATPVVEPPPVQPPTVPPDPTAEPTPVSYTINQDVQVGTVRWKVLEVHDLGNTLKSDNQFIEPKTTSGKFIQIRFEIENRGKDQLNFTGTKLTDGQDRSFTAKDDVFGFIPNEELCPFEQLNANVPKTCQAIYEVPADAQSLQLIVGDLELFGASEAKIALGL